MVCGDENGILMVYGDENGILVVYGDENGILVNLRVRNVWKWYWWFVVVCGGFKSGSFESG